MTDYLHALPSGYRIEEYELVRVLGSGGFGITYLGYDRHLDKAVAIKEYLPNDLAVRTDNQSVLPKSTQDRADYEWGLERFLSEAQTLARFDHRHIIKIHRFFRAHGTGYIVMEYAEGETLSDVLQRKGSLTETELNAILFPILDGLEAVHEADFLHRDIKTGNIVIRDDGSPVLIDFGSARQAVAGKSRSVTAIVTPGYAPIEQYSVKGHQGPWTDIYGLGAVCYRCLAGEPPNDVTERLRDDPLVPATQQCKGKAGKAFLEAIDRALRVDEGERPQSVAEWREMLSNTTAAPAYRQIEETAKLAEQSSLSSFLTTLEEKFLYLGLVLVLIPIWIWFPVWEETKWGKWLVGIGGVAFICMMSTRGTRESPLTKEFYLLQRWLFFGLVSILLLVWATEQNDWWLLMVTVGLIGFYVYSLRLLFVKDAVLVVLIIGGMLSIPLFPMWNIILGLIMVGVAARIIMNYGVRENSEVA